MQFFDKKLRLSKILIHINITENYVLSIVNNKNKNCVTSLVLVVLL